MAIKLPVKDRYCISEIIPVIQDLLCISTAAARMFVYRRISSGEIKAKSYLGSMRVEREEVLRIMTGEQV